MPCGQERTKVVRIVVDIVCRIVADIDVRQHFEGRMPRGNHAVLVDGGNIAIDQDPPVRIGDGACRRPDQDGQFLPFRVPSVLLRADHRRYHATLPVARGIKGQRCDRPPFRQIPKRQGQPDQRITGGQQQKCEAEWHGQKMWHRP
ncbi:hypothetical protein D3C71_1749710 [compost metagenome]